MVYVVGAHESVGIRSRYHSPGTSGLLQSTDCADDDGLSCAGLILTTSSSSTIAIVVLETNDQRVLNITSSEARSSRRMTGVLVVVVVVALGPVVWRYLTS